MTVKFEKEISSVAIRVDLLICPLKYRWRSLGTAEGDILFRKQNGAKPILSEPRLFCFWLLNFSVKVNPKIGSSRENWAENETPNLIEFTNELDPVILGLTKVWNFSKYTKYRLKISENIFILPCFRHGCCAAIGLWNRFCEKHFFWRFRWKKSFPL